MKLAVLALVGAMSALPIAALADDAKDNPLIGTWRVTSFKTRVIGEDQERDVFGSHPVGVVVFTPEHRIISIIAADNRKPATNNAEAAALLQSMIAYTGKLRLEQDRFTTDVEVSWNQIYIGTPQVRFYTVEGDRLTVRTPEQQSAVLPGKRITNVLTFERER